MFPFHIQGTHRSLQGDQNAKATVTAIIDGTGSLGAAFGPLIIGWFTSEFVSSQTGRISEYLAVATECFMIVGLALTGLKITVVSLPTFKLCIEQSWHYRFSNSISSISNALENHHGRAVECGLETTSKHLTTPHQRHF